MKKSLVSRISWLLVIAMMASMPLAAFADEPLKANVTFDSNVIKESNGEFIVDASKMTLDGNAFKTTLTLSSENETIKAKLDTDSSSITVELTSDKLRGMTGDVLQLSLIHI